MTILKGFRFGMLLQIAVCPICLLVFNTSIKQGFWGGFTVVWAVVLVDAIYIALSGLSIAAIIRKEPVQIAVKIIGSIILVLFGVNIVLDVFHLSFIGRRD